MANNENGHHRPDENRGPQDQRDDERRWSSRDDGGDRDRRGGSDEPSRWSVMGRNWEDDRDEGYHSTDRYGQGQSGYGAGRYADDRSQGYMNRNAGGAGRQIDDDREGMSTDDRWTGRGGQGYWEDRVDRERDFGDEEHAPGGYNSGYNQGNFGYGGYAEARVRRSDSQRGFRGGASRSSGDPEGAGPYAHGGTGYYGHGHQGQYDPGHGSSGYEQRTRGQGGMYGPYGWEDGPDGPSPEGDGPQGPGQGRSGGYARGGPSAFEPGGMQNLQGVQGGGWPGQGMGPGYDQPGQGPSVGMHRGKGPLGYARSDERIREAVCEALTDDPHVDASNIEVVVHNGEVILTGSVEDRYAKRLTEDIVAGCLGVNDVQNNLRVAADARMQRGASSEDAVGKYETEMSTPSLGAPGRASDGVLPDFVSRSSNLR